MKEACLNSAREIEAGILPYVTLAAGLAVVLGKPCLPTAVIVALHRAWPVAPHPAHKADLHILARLVRSLDISPPERKTARS
jgi:hypothetical protein